MSDPAGTRSKIELLKSLGGRVKPASDHFTAAIQPPARARKGPPLTELVPGAERIAFGGMSCVRLQTRAPLDGTRTPQGYSCPAGAGRGTAFGAASARHVADAVTMLGRKPDGDDYTHDFDLTRLAFLDTETTSLSGGAGAVAFLVGLGRFDLTGPAPEFVVTQFFMEDYDQEEALIEAVEAEIARSDSLASYNGRCFDVPILESRWRMHRRKPAFPARHVDLLHPARRLWRRRLPDCRLGTVERQLLGVMRVSDVESSLVPRIFNDYARGVQPGRILGVLDHHAQDIFSLGALLARLSRALTDPAAAEFAHAEDQWGLAGILHQAGRAEESLACLERAAGCARDADFAFRLAMHLARRLMRLGRITDAADIFRARTEDAAPSRRIEAMIELAKLHEHKLRDISGARAWAELAMQSASAQPPALGDLLLANLARRIARLNQRAAGSRG